MSKLFSSRLNRLLLAGIIVLLSLYLGIIWQANAIPRINKVPVKNVSANISQSMEKGISLNVDGETFKLTGEDIKRWTQIYTRRYSGEQDIRLNTYEMLEYINSLAPIVNSEPSNAKFEMTDGRVGIFQPAIRGKRLDIHGSVFALASALRNGSNSADLVIEELEPEITLEKVNSLGINKLLSRGESDFSGSSSARIHNIKIGSVRFNGILIKPGEEFSFNKILGEVDGANGYLAELVIKNGKLALEYGGGICQVSTTLFRSAIYAGLPIVERKPHSFPVRYYNPQGFDATIYPGVVDLRFTNDTPSYILVQSKIQGSKLIFEMYGSSDGRTVAVQSPVQYDQKRSGAMKAYFMRSISYADGQTKEERFDSVYKAPVKAQEKNPME